MLAAGMLNFRLNNKAANDYVNIYLHMCYDVRIRNNRLRDYRKCQF